MNRGVVGVRLMWEEPDGSEHVRDFAALSEAREHVTQTMTDWVIFERVEPGRYCVAGRVLDSK